MIHVYPVSDTEGGNGLQFRKEHTFETFAYINSWTQRPYLCCFKEYKHLEIFNQVVCALNNLVIAEVQVLWDQLCKHCTTINILGWPKSSFGFFHTLLQKILQIPTWQDESNQVEEPLNIEKSVMKEYRKIKSQ